MNDTAPLTRRQTLGGLLATGLLFPSVGYLFAADAAEGAIPRVRPLPSDGKTPIPLLGLGCAERFPLQKLGQPGAKEYAISLIDFALKHGIKWLDTGYAYHKGKSEPFLGEVLKRYPRESFYLSTKMPTWQVKSLDDAKRIFEDQLARCQVEYFDFYLLHSISRKEDFERVYVQQGVLDYLIERKKAGQIRHLGLSYHGKSDYLDELLGQYPGLFEVCMVMQNAMEFRWNPDSPNLSAVAARHGVGVLVMEPLAGGRAAALTGEALKILKDANPKDTAGRWGIRFAASQPGVICVFSGMGRLAHLEENIETLSDSFRPLSPDERKTYEAAIAVYMKHDSIPCTGCSYCLPCPFGIRIPELFAWYNNWAQGGHLPADEGENASQDLRRAFLLSYRKKFRAKERAEKCTNCEKCLQACPQWTFKIPKEMKKIADLVRHTEEVYAKNGGTL